MVATSVTQPVSQSLQLESSASVQTIMLCSNQSIAQCAQGLSMATDKAYLNRVGNFMTHADDVNVSTIGSLTVATDMVAPVVPVGIWDVLKGVGIAAFHAVVNTLVPGLISTSLAAQMSYTSDGINAQSVPFAVDWLYTVNTITAGSAGDFTIFHLQSNALITTRRTALRLNGLLYNPIIRYHGHLLSIEVFNLTLKLGDILAFSGPILACNKFVHIYQKTPNISYILDTLRQIRQSDFLVPITGRPKPDLKRLFDITSVLKTLG
jgi:hypothetical protein